MNVTKQLYQWDTGQKLTECTGIYVDYLIGDEVYRVEITDGTCIIPDELLQTSGRYKVWECMADNTLREFAFKVLPRPIPPNYVFTPTEQLTFEGLVQKETNKFNTNAIEKLNAYNANADNRVAEFNAQTEQIQADVSELKSDLVKLEDTDKSVNIFDYRTVTANKFIDNGLEVILNGYYCSDYIEVKPVTWYCIPLTSNVLCSLYNDGKEYIGNCKKSDYTQPSTQYSIFKTNASTKYIRVNGYNGGGTGSVNVSPTKYMVVEGQTYPNRYHKFGENTISDSYKTSNYLYGKTLLTYGDSITEGVNASTDEETGYKKTYAGLVAKRNGMNFVNLGWAGSTMADDDQKPFIHNGQIYSQFDNKLVTPDYITVWFGWNDYAHAQKGTGITLGTIASEDESTYYGAYIKACKLLIQKFPKARIGLIVPYGMDTEWRNAVRTVAKKFGLPYLDLYNNCPCIYNDEDGVNTDIANLRQSTFLADGTHPNDDGYEWLSTAYEDFLRRI